MSILTISRQMSSLGDEIAETLARRLGWELITRDVILSKFLKDLASPQELHLLKESARHYLIVGPNRLTYKEHLEQSLRQYAQTQSAVLVGFGSQIIFADDKDALHIRITAPEAIRIARIKKQYHVSDIDAGQILVTADKKHKRFVSTVFGIDLAEAAHYHLTLNTAALSVEECVAAVIALQKEHEQRRQLEKQTEYTDVVSHLPDRPVFKNAAEIEFAQILDMYQIDWIYEPKTFPIEWDAEGNITLAFSPDFYLTQFDTYIELTTMNQKYVTIKNRKVKRLRELYPGIKIKIVYKKDFQTLVERFNKS
ncbi:MAG: cytidylate kinase family protein [Clostridiaceae bacterium]|nr:cytidylate kinase family protein [Clostridiaceae bacterium]